jgi:hypothetical protein
MLPSKRPCPALAGISAMGHNRTTALHKRRGNSFAYHHPTSCQDSGVAGREFAGCYDTRMVR